MKYSRGRKAAPGSEGSDGEKVQKVQSPMVRLQVKF